MCFTRDRNDRKAKIATKSIKVFKILVSGTVRGQRESPLNDQGWKVGNIVCSKFGHEGDEIREGLHCFKTLEHASNYGVDNLGWKVYPVIIPKGAKYYTNRTQMVSNRMILKSLVPIKRLK